MKKLFFLLPLLPLCLSAQIHITGTRLLVDSRFDAPQSQCEAFIGRYRPAIDSVVSPQVGTTARAMSARQPESALSNLLADILVAAGDDYGERPDLGLYNMGGIRAALPAGRVTYGDILEIAPFENKICFLTLDGQSLMELFEQIAATGGQGVSRGVKLDISEDGRLINATLHGKTIRPKAKYRIATIDYLAQGNDHLEALRRKTRYNAPTAQTNDTRYIIADYFRRSGTVDARIEGRITVEGRQATEPAQAADKAGKTITVLHTNDTHSTIDPLSTNLSDTLRAGRAGAVRRERLIAWQRSLDPELLLFDSGDFSQGSAYYTLYKGEVEIGLMNRLGYDAATIGNHEFDFGLDNMARIFRQAQFPIVCANYDFTGTPVAGLTRQYTVFTRHGRRIGVFGLSPKLEGLVAEQNCQGVRYLDPIATARQMIDKLRKDEHCDIVICLSHLGWDMDGEDDEDVIHATHGIDLVLGGHSHSWFPNLQWTTDNNGEQVPDDQNGKHAVYVGKIIIKN